MKSRESGLVEFMDDPNCDLEKLHNTYSFFKHINAAASQWRRIYQKYLRPLIRKKDGPYTLLDVGFGGGDISLSLLKWAKKDGLVLNITAVDLEPRAVHYAERYLKTAGLPIEFHCVSTSELVQQGQQFDFVISNHVLHHLTAEELGTLLEDAEALAMKRVIFNDVCRSPILYGFFKAVTLPVFGNHYIVHDGLVSIRRSYNAEELQQSVPSSWTVTSFFPYRLLLMFDRGDGL